MSKYLKLLCTSFVIISLSGCVQFLVKTGTSQKDHPLAAPARSKKSYTLFGLGHDQVSPNEYKICKDRDGVAFVERRKTFGEGFLGIITLGIYSPYTLNLYCADANTGLDLTKE